MARDLDAVLHLLNGEMRNDRPVPDARVCMTWRGNRPQFWVFARRAAKPSRPHDGLGAWEWTAASEAEDVVRFLREDFVGVGPVRQVQVAAVWSGKRYVFYVFFRRALPERETFAPPEDWTWTMAVGSDDALGVLNGDGLSSNALRTARIAATRRGRDDELFLFYPRGGTASPAAEWRWQSVDSPDGVRGVVERRGLAPVDFQVAAPSRSPGAFGLFTHPDRRAAA